MKVNNAKEYCIFPEINNNLELKQTFKEIKKNKRQEFFSELKEIFSSSTFKCIAVNIVLAIIIVLCSYAFLNSVEPLDYNSVSPDKRIILKIAIGFILVLCVPLSALY